jgi:DNA polymerase-3 subunit epsilon
VIKFFNQQWDEVDTTWIDTETTGTKPGFDRCVQIAVVRFQAGEPVGSARDFINPGIPIPEAAAAIHGITDLAVKDAPAIHEFMARADVQALLKDSQPAAYNAPFDKHFVPPFGDDWTWPWLDALSLVRKVDRFAKGAGRHKLEATCKRHGIELVGAHEASADATAAGRLFYKLGRQEFPRAYTLGAALTWQRRVEAEEWSRFMGWLSTQPPREESAQ